MRLDLSGYWAASEATDELRRQFVRPELDDSGWARARVPGHWQDEEAFARSDGPLLYRRRFSTERLSAGERAWLVVEGAFYQADVWLDGWYLGDMEGYFFPHHFEVTAALQERREHVLAVEVACPRASQQRSLLGAWADPACVSSSFNPGGIWAPVSVTTSGPVRLAKLSVACLEAKQSRAVLELAAALDAVEPADVELVASFTGPAGSHAITFTKKAHLAVGANRARWRAVVPNPALWWPAGLGPQPLYEVRAAVSVQGATSDARSFVTGLREVRVNRMTWEVNGEQVFLQGAELVPTRRNLAAARPEEVARLILVARDAGLNLLRAKQHVGHPALYRAADELGVLLWQDLPGPGGWRGRAQAVRQAREAAWLLSHHPSIIAWATAAAGRRGSRRSTTGPIAVASATWPLSGSWAAERAVKKAVEDADGSRPVLSGVPALAARLVSPGQPAQPSRQVPRVERLERLGAIWPAVARFVVGAGSPPSAGFSRPTRWPELRWDELANDIALDKAWLLGRCPAERFESFESWAAATREEQAHFARLLVEGLRRMRSYPVRGFVLSRLNDAQESLSSSLLDYEGSPKPAWEAVKRSLAPLLPVASGLGASYRPGGKVAFGLWVLNSEAQATGVVELLARLSWPGGGRAWRFAGEAPARSTSFVAHRAVALPSSASLALSCSPPWLFRLELKLLRRGREVASNAYACSVEAEPELRPHAVNRAVTAFACW
jgi:beta-mannosidase